MLAGVAAAAVVFGVVVRLIHFNSTLLADELSTLYIAHGHSLGEVLSLVKSDAEISPPLYFVLAWLSHSLGRPPTWSGSPL